MTDSDARNWALFAHLSQLIGGFLGPLIIWAVQKDKHPFVAAHAAEALNFNLSNLIYHLAAAFVWVPLAIFTLGLALIVILPLLLASAIAVLVFVVIASVKASHGEYYRYPLTIRMVR